MDINSLRKLIKEEVDSVLDEAAAVDRGVPKTLNEFRTKLASAMKKAKAPPGMIAEVEDLGSEGGGVFGKVWGAWDNIRQETQGVPPEELPSVWEDLVEFYVHDCIIDLCDEYGNAWNYGPGERRGKEERVDPPALAQAVVNVMLGMPAPKPTTTTKKAKSWEYPSMLPDDAVASMTPDRNDFDDDDYRTANKYASTAGSPGSGSRRKK